MARKPNRKQSASRRSPKRAATTRTRKRAPTAPARRKTAARSAATRRRRTAPAPKAPSRLRTAAALVKGTVAGAAAAVASKLPWTDRDADALDMLERDHRRFEDLLEQGTKTTERAAAVRRNLLATLTAELTLHELKEEKVLYPALESHSETRDTVLEGLEEHHVADLVATELKDVAVDDETWGAKFKVLKESIEHHIKEEEREMFRSARGILSRDELLELAARMRALDPARRRR